MANENRYTARCNDPAERERWRSSGLVRVDSLRRGDVFESIDGDYWRVVGASRSGTIQCHPMLDGVAGEEIDTFVSSALVRLCGSEVWSCREAYDYTDPMDV